MDLMREAPTEVFGFKISDIRCKKIKPEVIHLRSCI